MDYIQECQANRYLFLYYLVRFCKFAPWLQDQYYLVPVHIQQKHAAGGGLAPAYEEIIPLTSDSTLSADVIKVSHFPNSAKIIIYLKTPASERRCEFPTFRARLSGDAIAIVEWDVPLSTWMVYRQVIPINQMRLWDIIEFLQKGSTILRLFHCSVKR